PRDGCDRHTVGAAGIRAHPRETGGDAVDELEDDRRRRGRYPFRRGCGRHESVRHRNPYRRVPHTARHSRGRRPDPPRKPGCDPGRADRADLPAGGGQHLRRRSQRGAARYGRHPGIGNRQGRPRPMNVLETLNALVGRELQPTTWAPAPVNTAMIRHWVEAMGDTNPISLDDDAARATGRDGLIAPPTMVQAWTMRGYAATAAGNTAS